MLTIEEIREKLFRMAEVFEEKIYRKEYQKAKYTYDTALTVACFIDLEEADKNKLFGNREIGRIGAFDERKVQMAFYHTCVKGNKDRSDETYAEFLARHIQKQEINNRVKK